jgi:L-malate glycosyltransferase
MRVLFIANAIFPVPGKELGIPYSISGGGWISALAKQLISTREITLAIATVYTGREIKSIKTEEIIYYLLPAKSKTEYHKNLEPAWQKICDEYKPDIIHIHGTEYPHGLACMRACEGLSYVISIQGLISIYTRYYFAGIRIQEVIKNITFRDVLKIDTLFQGHKNLKRRTIFEKEFVVRTRHIIGRTSWDYAHARKINPNVTYHFCNEILRDSFYDSPKWDVNNKNNYTLFISQSTEPLKGLHQVIKAVALLKNDFPEIKIRVAGPDILRNTSILERFKRGGYGSYIKNMIDKYNLNEQICFTGPLGEEQMASEYKNAHIFICPSSIENSPNSLGEAQLIGVPSISSYVGGVPDMVTHGETGLLYRFEEVEMLAENIREIFTNDKKALELSKNGILVAEKRHNKRINVEQTIKIYKAVVY